MKSVAGDGAAQSLAVQQQVDQPNHSDADAMSYAGVDEKHATKSGSRMLIRSIK